MSEDRDSGQLLIREARASDDALLGELLVDAFVQKYARRKPDFPVPEARRAELRDLQRHRSEGCVLVAELDGRVVGTVTLYRPGSGHAKIWLEGYAELRFLAVLPEFQGRGLGVPLVQAAKDTCRAWGARGIAIRVRQGLDRLVAFYESHGFVRDPRGDMEYSPGILLEGFESRG